jgi:biotin carboxyl carrier protein
MRKYAVKIDGKERLVELGDDGEVRVDGERFGGEVVEAEAGLLLIRTEKEQVAVRVDGVGGKLGVAVRRGGRDPVILTAEVSDARRAKIVVPERAGGAAGAPVTVKSPIPGRVVKVLVKHGDEVKAGQTVVVLEAMKMENELRAPRAGTVTEVRAAEGTAVEAGQELVSLR